MALADDVRRSDPVPGRGDALATLVHFGGEAPIHALVTALAVSHSGAVRVVDRLVEDGLVERRRRDDDRRAVTVALTRAGRRAATASARARAGTIRELLAPLDEKECGVLSALLERLLAARAGREDTALRTCRRCDAEVCGHPERCPVTVGTAAR